MASKQELENTVFFEFDFTKWRMRDIEEVQKATREAAQSESFRPLMEQMAKVTSNWQYEGDPRDVESWLNLRPNEYAAASKAFNESLAASFR